MSDTALEFLLLIGELKRLKRTGWVNNKVDGPESVSDHMHRMGVMALLIPPESGLDTAKCVRMAIVHDLGECIAGDITPNDNVSDEEKFKMEKDAFDQLISHLTPTAGKLIKDLWLEYEAAETPEALLVKDFDKFEMLVTAYEYERDQGYTLEQFYTTTVARIKHPLVRQWLDDLMSKRAALELKPHRVPGGA